MDFPRVLVVDDNPSDLTYVVEALSDAKYTFVTEVDSRRALKRFEDEGPWHLVISDLKMPGIDGLTLLKRIRAHDPSTETIIMTAHADISSAIEALSLGAFSYLRKPFHHEELRHCVARALERHGFAAEQRRLIKELEERDARRRREIATIASMGDMLRWMRSPTEIPENLLRNIAIALEAEGVACFLLDEVGNELLLTAHQGIPQAIADKLTQRRLLTAEGPVGPLVHRGELALMERAACPNLSLCTPIFRAAGVKSPLCAPLKSQNVVFGCIAVLTLSPGVRAFTSEDREFLEAVGYLIGNAIQAWRREQQAHDAEKLAAVGELAAGVAHELGNVLAVIGGSVQFLLANTDAASPSRQYLEAIHRNVAAGDRIIKGLLSFARPSPPSLEATEIESVLERACLLLKGDMAKVGVKASRQYWSYPLQVLADAQQMQQVFLNILLNAIQAMPRGGTVTLRTFPEPADPPWAGMRVEITDTGTGIPEEYLHRVFDPFFTTKEAGTGLGLSVSHRIVAAHGGKLSVETQKGRGTRFVVRLPMRPPAEERRAVPGMSHSAAPPDHGRAA